MSKSSRYCFTINNPNYDDWPILWCDTDKVAFMIASLEKGEEKETLHWQGYIRLKQAQRFSYVKNLHKKAHWEQCKGNEQQNIDYVTKKPVEGPWEIGSRIASGERTDIRQLYDDVVDEKTDAQLAQKHDAWFKYHVAVTKLRGALHDKPRTKKPYVCWRWGPTGTGKSFGVFQKHNYKDIYTKDMSDGKWWDKYMQQPVVLLEDMRKDTFKFHELLRLFDMYPMTVQYKGGSIHFNSDYIYVTSCYPPDKLYETREDVKQLLRRIDLIENIKVCPVPEVGKGNTSLPNLEPENSDEEL